ncbi:MAG: PAS domain S-box protein, partial [Bdellovibrionales bacterium]
MAFDPKNSGFFIEPALQRNRAKPKTSRWRMALLFLVSAIYALAILWPLAFHKEINTFLSFIIIYFYGILGAIGILLIKKGYANTDRSRRLLSEVLERSAEARAITDQEGKLIYANESYCQLVGQENPEDLSGFEALLTANNRPGGMLNDLRAKINDNGSHNAETGLRIAGKQRWYDVSCTPIQGWAGYAHWRFDDITGHHDMEHAV